MDRLRSSESCMHVSRPISLVSTLALAVAIVAPGVAQNAKPSDEFAKQRARERGDLPGRGSDKAKTSGNALDANTQIGGSGFNQPGQKVDYQARNLIATHDVAG